MLQSGLLTLMKNFSTTPRDRGGTDSPTTMKNPTLVTF